MLKLLSGSPSSGAIVRVRWQSRTAAFTNASVEGIIQKASQHFGLGGTAQPDLVLLATVEGEELEVTNDILAILPKGTTLTLSRLRKEEVAPPTEAQGSLKAKDADVVQHVCPEDPPEYGPPSMTPPSHVTTPIGMFVWVLTRTGKWYVVECRHSDTVRDLKERLHGKGTVPPDQQRLIFAGRQLEDLRTVSDYSIHRGSIVHFELRLRSRKPVIYLFPPTPIPDAHVSVSLIPQWSFSHVYPLAAPKQLEDGRQRIDWSVSARPDGTLIEKATSLALSYLFWEAESNPGPSLPHSPPLIAADSDAEYFDPAYPVLDYDTPTAVLIPFAELLPYLDAALKKLSLHTSARNDFITYWLPKLASKPFVALRFLPQAAYDRAAELNVQPAPDTVTRVFMLFRGVASEDAEERMWSAARARVREVDWVKVVGLEPGAWDESRFRVLEWGAMEVL